MRFIDEIIRHVKEHPSISETHKQVLINRIKQPPISEELEKAKTQVDGNLD